MEAVRRGDITVVLRKLDRCQRSTRSLICRWSGEREKMSTAQVVIVLRDAQFGVVQRKGHSTNADSA